MSSHHVPGDAFAWSTALLLTMAQPSLGLGGEADYASRVGVFLGCLSIQNDELTPGTPVTVISFNEEEEDVASGDTTERHIAGKIVGMTESVEHCPTLVEERNLREDAGEFTIYIVASDTSGALDSVDFGIAIVGLESEHAKAIDLDGNGKIDSFSEFSSLGSLIFEVWSGAPFFGKPLWTGYYVFGHGPEGEDAE
jgi:hypothetical protein